jgi:hypothetical protein
MQRVIRYATLIGAVLLGAGCEDGTLPEPAEEFRPQPKYIDVAEPSLITRTHGFVWDPEAFFLSMVSCGKTCPLPPTLFDFSPLYKRSVFKDAKVLGIDPMAGQPVGPPVVSNELGLWSMNLPRRSTAPFFTMTVGAGTLNQVPMPLTPIPPPTRGYLPTLSLRPIATNYGTCTGLEAAQLSDNGILEAVARYLTEIEGNPTTVQDFLSPEKYAAVTVFWLYHPGFPFLRVPADSTTVEASAGRVINVAWAPPGALPPGLAPLQSTRGFFAPPGATYSGVGISVVLLPRSATPPPPVVTYLLKDMGDPTVNPTALRPWSFMPLKIPPIPGTIGFAGQ